MVESMGGQGGIERRGKLSGSRAVRFTQPTSNYEIKYFRGDRKRRDYYILNDKDGSFIKAIMGQDAAVLKRILTSEHHKITGDIVKAFRPLVLEVFSEEMGLYEEDMVYADSIFNEQPKAFRGETAEEVYRRFWRGHLMPGKITADEVADAIIKDDPKVKSLVLFSSVPSSRVDDLADLIREYHPRGRKGK